MKPGK